MTSIYDRISQNLDAQRMQTAAGVSAGIDAGDPDEAGRAMQLADATGVEPSVVASDVPNFEKIARTQMAHSIVANNPHLSEYIRRNSLAGRVSADDWGNLDNLSQTVTRGWGNSGAIGQTGSMIQGAINGFKEGVGNERLGYWLTDADIRNHPLLSSATAPFEVLLRGLSGVLEGAKGAVAAGTETAALQMGSDPADAKRFGRDMGGVVQMFTDQPLHLRPTIAPESIAKAREALVASHPWIDVGREPPAGLHPDIDKAKVEQNNNDLDLLKQAGKGAQASLTKERAPRLLEDLIDDHTNAKIGVSPDAIRQLYGEKIPTADDGILGFVPDLQNKLRIAEASGQDIQIPLSTWLARVDPSVANELRDFTRVRPGGITKFEEQSLPPTEPPGVINTPLEAVRNAAGLKVLYDTGERELKLQRLAKQIDPNAPAFMQGMHDFELVDEKGNARVALNLSEQKDGKQLYVEWVGGAGVEMVNQVGPSLIRSVLRQLKEAFPNAEEVAGFRVSGARDKAGTFTEKGHVKVRFDEDLDTQISNIVKDATDGMIDFYGHKFRPTEELKGKVAEIDKAIMEEIDRLVPSGVQAGTFREIRTPKGQAVGGGYFFGKDIDPFIAVSLQSPDPLKTARHEVIHHLSQSGFFTDGEWRTLENSALEGKWLEKHGIDEKYKGLDQAGKIEEAIAEEFGQWLQGAKAAPEVHTLFERLKELLINIGRRLKSLIGDEPAFKEIFEAIESGEIGSREVQQAVQGAQALYQKGQLDLPGMTRMEDREIFKKASDLGMTVDEYKRRSKLIEEQNKEDYDRAIKKAEAEVRRRQTATWKENSAKLRPEAVENINSRPAVAADNYFRDGNYFGKQAEPTKLLDSAIPREMIDRIPKAYVSKTGVAPDELAGFFGFHTGDALLEGLAQYREAQLLSKKQPLEFKRGLVDLEVQRLMEQRYGKLADEILAEAKDQAASQSQINLLHEDTLRLATKAGVELPIDMAALRQQVAKEFRVQDAVDVSSDAKLAEINRASRMLEVADAKEDWAEAFRQAQRRKRAVMEMAEARLFEDAQGEFEKIAKPYLSRENRKSRSQEYTNYIQDLLQEAGLPVKFLPEEIAANINFERGLSLESFVREKLEWGYEPDVADWIAKKQGIPKLDKMTAGQMEDFMNAIKSLDELSKREQSIEIKGAKEAWIDWKKKVIERIESLEERSTKSMEGGWRKRMFQFDAMLTRPEEIIRDLDLREDAGPLFDAIIVPMMRSKAKEYDLITDLSKHFKEVKDSLDGKWRKSLNDTIPQDFLIDPKADAPYDLNRNNLINMMLYWGTESNRDKLAGSFAQAALGRRPKAEEVQAYHAAIDRLIHNNAKAEDWEFVKAMWKPFKKWQPEMDAVSRNVSGIVPKWIPGMEFDTRFGKVEGSYWPISYDPIRSGIDNAKERQVLTDNGLMGPNTFRAATSKNHLKARVDGFYDHIDINRSIEQAAGVMQQTIHDISFRDALVQAGKVLYDKDIRNAIRHHYGQEYLDQMIPWLRRVARINDAPQKEIAAYNDILRRVRTNLVTTALGNNLKVIFSPDVGVPNPMRWARFEANRSENVKLAMEKSQEIRHLVYNMDRDYREALNQVQKSPLDAGLHQKIIDWSFKPAMKFSQEFRMSTFVHEYQRAKADGHSDAQAAQIADSHVRAEHGAASVVDLPSIMQSSEALKAGTMFYGYFNTMYNLNRRLVKDTKAGEWGNVAKTIGAVYATGVFFNWLTFTQPKEKESTGKYLARTVASVPMSLVPIGRDVASYTLDGFAPSSPLASLIKTTGPVWNDVRKMAQGQRPEKAITHIGSAIGLTANLPMNQPSRTAQGLYDVAKGYQKPKNIQEWWWLLITGEARAKR